MTLFPMFLKLEGRSCLVVGAGRIGEPKIRSLLATGARVRVIAPDARRTINDWAAAGVIDWQARPFRSEDLEGVFLVIAATPSSKVNQEIFEDAQRRRILCNSVDDPDHCDFFFPAVVRRGNLQLAISTGGQSPALAQRLRRELDTQFTPEYAGWVEELGSTRRQILRSNLDQARRRDLLHSLASVESFQARQSRRKNGVRHEG